MPDAAEVIAGIIVGIFSPVILPFAVGYAIKETIEESRAEKLSKWLAEQERSIPAVVVLGITGAGKSTLLNVLFGTSFETGCGRPITTEGLHQQDVEIGSHTLRVFDSCGFETKLKSEDARMKLLNEVWEKCTRDKLTVLYCINAAGGRVNKIDKQTIRGFESDGVHVVVAFTKADQTSEEDTDAMRQVLHDAGIHSTIVDVCSVEEGQSKRFGVDEVLETIIGGK